MQNTIGVQLRHDDIAPVGLYHTVVADAARDHPRRRRAADERSRASPRTRPSWTPWLRTLAGVRVDGYRFDVDASDPRNSGTDTAGLVSPKGGVVLGPVERAPSSTRTPGSASTATTRAAPPSPSIRRPGDPVDRVTPLARARGAEVGLRTVRIPHLQSSVALWTLSLDSELVFVGDAGTTEAGRPSHRYGVEWANYYSPLGPGSPSTPTSRSLERASPTTIRRATLMPGAVQTVLSAGATVDHVHGGSSAASAGATSVRVRWSRTTASLGGHEPRQPAVRVSRSRRRCGLRWTCST